MFFIRLPGSGGYNRMMTSTAEQLGRMILMIVTFIPWCLIMCLIIPPLYVARALYRTFTPQHTQRRIAARVGHGKVRAAKVGKIAVALVIMLCAVFFTIGLVKAGSTHAARAIPAKQTTQPKGWKYHHCHKVIDYHNGSVQTVCGRNGQVATTGSTTGNTVTSPTIP